MIGTPTTRLPHVVVRGKDKAGRDLVIARDYITDGMHNRTSGAKSSDLG
jgi:hypothetical protein